jgi:hypothetical protein
MAEESDAPRSLSELRRDPNVLHIIRWLLEDRSRTLPSPGDEAAMSELVQATGISIEFARVLMARAYGDLSAGDTARLLT